MEDVDRSILIRGINDEMAMKTCGLDDGEAIQEGISSASCA